MPIKKIFPKPLQLIFSTFLNVLKKGNITKEKLKEWIEKPIIYKNTHGIDIGVLGFHKDWPCSFMIGSRSGLGMDSLEWIGLASFVPRKRRKQILSYSGIIKRGKNCVTEIKVMDNFVHYTIVSFNSSTPSPALHSNFELLDLLSKNPWYKKSKLNKLLDKTAIENKMAETMASGYVSYMKMNIYPLIANGMIVSSKIERIKEGIHLDKDNLKSNEIIDILEQKNLPTWKLSVEVSDPCWIEHLKDIKVRYLQGVDSKDRFKYDDASYAQKECLVWDKPLLTIASLGD